MSAAGSARLREALDVMVLAAAGECSDAWGCDDRRPDSMCARCRCKQFLEQMAAASLAETPQFENSGEGEVNIELANTLIAETPQVDVVHSSEIADDPAGYEGYWTRAEPAAVAPSPAPKETP